MDIGDWLYDTKSGLKFIGRFLGLVLLLTILVMVIIALMVTIPWLGIPIVVLGLVVFFIWAALPEKDE